MISELHGDIYMRRLYFLLVFLTGHGIFAAEAVSSSIEACSMAGGVQSEENYNNIFILGQTSPPFRSVSESYGELGGFLSLFENFAETSVKNPQDSPILPSFYILHQNFPNPFNPITTISYELPEKGYVKLYVFDITGRLVKTLQDGEQNAGVYQFQWSGENWNGKKVVSGLYFYRLVVNNYTKTEKMVLTK